MRTNFFSFFHVLIASASLVAACVAPQTASPENLSEGVDRGSLCYELEMARDRKDTARVDILIAEYARRHPRSNKENLDDLRSGMVGPGTPESIAVCAWTAELVNHSIGYGRNVKQYRGSGSNSYFFVNGKTGRVTFISV